MLDRAPEFVVRLNGTPWKVWTGINVTRAIDRMSGEFDVTFGMDRKNGDFSLEGSVGTGTPVEILIDGQIVLAGYTRTLQYGYDKESVSMQLTGRDRTIDLMDCAAAVNGPFEFTNISLSSAIEKVIQPYGLKLSVEAPVGANFKRLAIQPGESAYEFIDRACRLRGVLCVSNGVGGIVLVVPGKTKSPGQLVFGGNILSGNISHDESNQHSLYVVKGHSEAVDAGSEAATIAGPTARISDATIKRYRPKVIIAESQGNDMTLAERAAWEKKLAAARSKSASYSVRGWYANENTRELWLPNTLVKVADARAQLNREMLIAGVSYRRDEQSGTTCTLDLTMPEAFDIMPESEDGSGSSDNVWVADNA